MNLSQCRYPTLIFYNIQIFIISTTSISFYIIDFDTSVKNDCQNLNYNLSIKNQNVINHTITQLIQSYYIPKCQCNSLIFLYLLYIYNQLEDLQRNNSYSFDSPQKKTTQQKTGEGKENQSQFDFQESPGTKILRYAQSEYFGIKTEPVKISESIQEFVLKMMEENQKLQQENDQLQSSNNQFEHFIRNNEIEGLDKDNFVGVRGQEISQYDVQMLKLESQEVRAARVEKLLDRDISDVVEYVKWITNDLGLLRDRVRIAEKIIIANKYNRQLIIKKLDYYLQ